MFTTANYPDDWRKSYIHFISKPDGKSVRPVSLTSCKCKIFESLVKNRLQWWCETHNILPPSQTGFRKGRSCTNNLANLVLQADEMLESHKDLFAVFLDVCGAFDNVNIELPKRYRTFYPFPYLRTNDIY